MYLPEEEKNERNIQLMYISNKVTFQCSLLILKKSILPNTKQGFAHRGNYTCVKSFKENFR